MTCLVVVVVLVCSQMRCHEVPPCVDVGGGNLNLGQHVKAHAYIHTRIPL